MAQWGANDAVSNTPVWSAALVNLPGNSVNSGNLYNNTTPDAFITNQTVGVFNVSDQEMNNQGVASITIVSSGTGFTARPTLSIANTPGNVGVNATATAVGAVVAAVPNGPGTGGDYLVGEVLTENASGVGSHAKFNVVTTKLRTVALGNANGTGYAPNDTITCATPAVMTTNAVANVTNTQVATVTIVAAGTGYTNNDTVSPGTGTSSVNAVFTISTDASGNTTALAITNSGIYTVNPNLVANAVINATANSATGSGLTVTLSMGVQSLVLVTNGVFTHDPTFTNGNTVALTGVGSGAKMTVTTRVNTISVNSVGGYTTLPTLTNAATNGSANGTGFTVDLTIGVGATTVTNTGWGYTSAPTVTVGGTGGSGANAVAVLSGLGDSRGVAHKGWNLRRVGSGGRSGRITYETIVAIGGAEGADAQEDTVFPG